MSQEVALKVAKYIAQSDSIALNWFGGEPLYNIKAIGTITNYLIVHNKEFHSEMTTNGYLFNETVVKKAKELWNLTGVQITLDGTEKIYNKTKNYKDVKGTSPFM